MQVPRVSVIIPVYNTESYLRECLDSVVNQTLRDIEIICVDDGSTDGSLAILREYQEKDSRVSVYTQPNLNAGAARNHGLRYARGEYLSFLDSDDFFEPNMLENAYNHAKRQNAEICVFRCDAYDEESGTYVSRQYSIQEDNLPENRPFAGVEVKKNLFGTFVGWAWDKLFLRDYIMENEMRFQEQRTTNDLLFTYFALAKAKRISILEDVLVHHRTQVKTSLEATRNASWNCFYLAFNALRDALQNAGLYEHFERDFINYCLNFSLWNLYTLPWPTQELVYYHLKLFWFDALNVPGHDETYYYNKDEYILLQKVLKEPYSDISPEILKQRIAEQEQRIAEQERCIAERDKWLRDLKSSFSFRLGRGITWAPRKLRGGVRCYREHGLSYTARRFLERTRGKT